MLGRLVLILLQLGVGFFLGQQLLQFIPLPGDLRFFALAIAFAIVVWIIGLVGAEVLKGVDRPSPAALLAALIVSLIAVAVVTYVPQVKGLLRGLSIAHVALIGAVIGYQLRK